MEKLTLKFVDKNYKIIATRTPYHIKIDGPSSDQSCEACLTTMETMKIQLCLWDFNNCSSKYKSTGEIEEYNADKFSIIDMSGHYIEPDVDEKILIVYVNTK